MSANFNNAAWFYDALSRMVYGRALINAQIYLLRFIPANSRVLIIGGGTGWILEELTKIQPLGLTITYVESSEKMMRLSKKRNIGGNQVIFIQDPIEHLAFAAVFDVVITPFLFDNFTEQTLSQIFTHVHGLLKPCGLWLYADFQLSGKVWQRVLLGLMFLLFRIICQIEGEQLADVEGKFAQQHYLALAEKTFFREFIISKVYRRTARGHIGIHPQG